MINKNIPEIITNNARLSADSFVNDQLKWRRLRIEQLTRSLDNKNKQIDNLKKMFINEIGIVDELSKTLKLINKNFKDDALNNMINTVIEATEKHINNSKNRFNNG